jgi:hypothetical protein
MKTRADINEMETKRMISMINETKSCFFEKINKTDKPLDKLTERIKKTQINKVRDTKWVITTDTNEIQKIIQEYFVNLYSHNIIS